MRITPAYQSSGRLVLTIEELPHYSDRFKIIVESGGNFSEIECVCP
jgi:hypothetical protein